MSGTQKTFRLGGAGGYSVRAVGHAPTRQGGKPTYTHVDLYLRRDANDCDAALLVSCKLSDDVKCIAPISRASLIKRGLSEGNAVYLRALVHRVWRNRSMS
jgi:hypothetical protein